MTLLALPQGLSQSSAAKINWIMSFPSQQASVAKINWIMLFPPQQSAEIFGAFETRPLG